MKENTTITDLILASDKTNQLCDADAEKFADVLKLNTTLEVLYLVGGKISDAGCKNLAAALKVNTSLNVLSLAANQIGDVGTEKLSDTLKVNTSLDHLDLAANQISDKGAEKLADTLKVNATLRFLLLDRNQIGDVGAEKFDNALKLNTRLVDLNLRDNQNNNYKSINLSINKNALIQKLLRDYPYPLKAVRDQLEALLQAKSEANIKHILNPAPIFPSLGALTLINILNLPDSDKPRLGKVRLPPHLQKRIEDAKHDAGEVGNERYNSLKLFPAPTQTSMKQAEPNEQETVKYWRLEYKPKFNISI